MTFTTLFHALLSDTPYMQIAVFLQMLHMLLFRHKEEESFPHFDSILSGILPEANFHWMSVLSLHRYKCPVTTALELFPCR